MWTPVGYTSSVVITEVSFIQGLELFNVTCLGLRDSVLFVEVSVFQGVYISRFHCRYSHLIPKVSFNNPWVGAYTSNVSDPCS